MNASRRFWFCVGGCVFDCVLAVVTPAPQTVPVFLGSGVGFAVGALVNYFLDAKR